MEAYFAAQYRYKNIKVFAATVKHILLSIISLDHNFLLCVLRNFGFDDNFITCIKMILNDQQSCVINGGFATQYFTLKKGAHQGDSRSTYLFIFALEVLWILITSKDNTNGIGLYDDSF